MPLVGYEWLSIGLHAKFGCRSKRSNFFLNYRASEVDDLDRHRKLSECGDYFSRVRDYHHFLRSGRDNLLTQQCAASAFDQVQFGIDFVRAIDGDVDIRMLIERSQWNTD